MSLASVHPVELHSSRSSLTTLSHSLDDITLSGCWNSPPLHSDHVMTIEELRLQMGSCFTCGVSWNESHVSLDCSECGGYAMERPCNICDGTCGAILKRDLSMSHASGKARWIGECARSCNNDQKCSSSDLLDNSANHKILTHELTKRLEKLSANS